MASKANQQRTTRYWFLVQGIVQGVGFRPFVYQLATKYDLTGHVGNDGAGVFIEIEGPLAAIQAFERALYEETPPLARIDRIQQAKLTVQNSTGFTIEASHSNTVSTYVAPDATVCFNCLQELFDPESRFFHYPFVNCTHCGPRYTITEALPYDRPNTAMKSFELCPQCHHDYHDPNNRRYHAQPIACPQCGPVLTVEPAAMAEVIQQGGIVAVKALGGYQLICDARNPETVQRLRQNKQRDSKPLALMALNTASVERYAQVSQTAKQCLQRPDNPIVILPQSNDNLPEAIAPGLQQLGFMLPYTPLHYLLLHHLHTSSHDCTSSHNLKRWLSEPTANILVVTSANLHGSPIIKDDDQARQQLSGIADLVVHHNRPIVTRVDDSVINLVNHQPFWVRRARGVVPQRIELPHAMPPTLALGGFLKNTVCLTRGAEAFVSQHIGDLDHPETLRYMDHTVEHLLKLFNVTPERVACDRHPDTYAYRKAMRYNLPCYTITHHYAHVASIMAEQHLSGSCLALALDGLGLGDNNELWGGELIAGKPGAFQRIGHLAPLALPGGDQAARYPWRIAASILHQLGYSRQRAIELLQRREVENIWPFLNNRRLAPLTSSCGRLFDAASALLGICHTNDFEGQAAMMLENYVTRPHCLLGGYRYVTNILDMTPCMNELIGQPPEVGANYFHGTLARALAEWVSRAGQLHQTQQVVLAGGCFLNRVLTELVTQHLNECGMQVYRPHALPINDGGLSLGQAWQAAHQ